MFIEQMGSQSHLLPMLHPSSHVPTTSISHPTRKKLRRAKINHNSFSSQDGICPNISMGCCFCTKNPGRHWPMPSGCQARHPKDTPSSQTHACQDLDWHHLPSHDWPIPNKFRILQTHPRGYNTHPMESSILGRHPPHLSHPDPRHSHIIQTLDTKRAQRTWQTSDDDVTPSKSTTIHARI